jgi:putative ABC transport system permease protein
MADMEAVRDQLGDRVLAATGVMNMTDRMLIGGREEDVAIVGSDDQYPKVRNFVVLAGRFMDRNEVALRQKVAMLTEKMATRLFGGQAQAIGQTVKIKGLQFTVIGTFRERSETFGLTELGERTILIPVTVMRYFAPVERIDPFYVQARSSSDVDPLAKAVRTVIESRHRPGAKYYVDSLGGILEAANAIGLILTMVLIMISAIALIISGIGIMNIMLVTVTERTREIGLRMAVGASKRAIQLQFLTEAILISLSGGLIGILAGLAVPLAARIALDNELDIQISGWSIAMAFCVSFFVGLIFGILPANRASQLSPTEALRYE